MEGAQAQRESERERKQQKEKREKGRGWGELGCGLLSRGFYRNKSWGGSWLPRWLYLVRYGFSFFFFFFFIGISFSFFFIGIENSRVITTGSLLDELYLRVRVVVYVLCLFFSYYDLTNQIKLV